MKHLSPHSSKTENLTQDSSQINLDGRYRSTEGSSDAFSVAYNFLELKMVKEMGLYLYHLPIEMNEGPIAVINGKKVIMLGSNNYLGLTIHPEVRKASADAVMKYGTSMTGSRLFNGTNFLHIELQNQLAEYFGKESCLVFTTGYQANLGILSAFFKKGTALCFDKQVHASATDGAKLGAGEQFNFKHNDMEDLDRVLSSIDPKLAKMVMVDGVYSMEGDVAPLDKIVPIAKKHSARVIVDDAHGVGILGGGRGTAAHFNLTDQVDAIVGTFSKTLASIGGFVAGETDVIEYIKHFGSSMIFSASLPPACTAAALKALEILKREPERVERLNENSSYMRQSLTQLGFDIGESTTAIVPIVVGEEIKCLQIWKDLLEEGVYVNAALYPAVSRNRAVLRTSYTAEHTREHLNQALSIFEKLKKKHSW